MSCACALTRRYVTQLDCRAKAPSELELQPYWDQLDELGYVIIPDWAPPEQIEKMRHAARTEFPVPDPAPDVSALHAARTFALLAPVPASDARSTELLSGL